MPQIKVFKPATAPNKKNTLDYIAPVSAPLNQLDREIEKARLGELYYSDRGVNSFSSITGTANYGTTTLFTFSKKALLKNISIDLMMYDGTIGGVWAWVKIRRTGTDASICFQANISVAGKGHNTLVIPTDLVVEEGWTVDVFGAYYGMTNASGHLFVSTSGLDLSQGI